MIPKIIHYTWFSGDPFPEEIQRCIDSWKKYLGGYEFRLWDYESIKEIDSEFLKEALAAKKWAYAADYVRLYALYNFGGIYLDTDVLIFKNFDSFLNHKAFIGKESYIHFTGSHSAQYLTSHCMGAEKNNLFIKRCLEYFEDRHFILSYNQNLPADLRYNFVLLPYIQAEIAKLFGYDWRPSVQNVQECNDGLIIYPSAYFDNYEDAEKSVCQHLALGSWREIAVKKDYNYSLGYKIKWRIIYMFQWILSKFGYVSMKIE